MGSIGKNELKKALDTSETSSIRPIHFTSNREHAVPYFVQSRILPSDSLFFQQIAYLMHDVNNHIVPNDIVTLPKKVRSVHSYRTRSASSDKFYLEYSRLIEYPAKRFFQNRSLVMEHLSSDHPLSAKIII